MEVRIQNTTTSVLVVTSQIKINPTNHACPEPIISIMVSNKNNFNHEHDFSEFLDADLTPHDVECLGAFPFHSLCAIMLLR